MAVKIQLRRDTAANWVSSNTILDAGEVGVEIDTGQLKVGNGNDPWNDLAYPSVPIPPVAHSQILIDEDYEFPINYNGISLSPVTLDESVDVTVPDGATWSILQEDNVSNSLFEDKGDLIVGKSAGVPTGLSVGDNSSILKANSSTTSGLEWSNTIDSIYVSSLSERWEVFNIQLSGSDVIRPWDPEDATASNKTAYYFTQAPTGNFDVDFFVPSNHEVGDSISFVIAFPTSDAIPGGFYILDAPYSGNDAPYWQEEPSAEAGPQGSIDIYHFTLLKVQDTSREYKIFASKTNYSQ